jgi:hypothetical protein
VVVRKARIERTLGAARIDRLVVVSEERRLVAGAARGARDVVEAVRIGRIRAILRPEFRQRGNGRSATSLIDGKADA